MSKTVSFPVKNVPVAGEYDFLVCGGGLSGIAAACNAADRGLKTAVIEYSGKPGGVPVSGLLGIVSGWRLEHEIAIDGKFHRELIGRVQKLGGFTSLQGWQGRFEPEKLALALLEMLLERKIRIMLQTQLIAAEVENNSLRRIFTCSKAGLEAWEAPLFADATGDGDLAVMAGCPYEYGRKQDGKVQSSSLTFKLAGIDLKRIPPNMTEATRIWRTESHLTPTNHTVITYLPNTNGEAAVNMTHILNCHPLTHEGTCRIRYEGTLQAFEIADFFRRHLPGFEQCYVTATAMQPGIRETRRILGDYILTEDDVIAGRDFEDEIARGAWGIDIHEPDRIHGETPMPHFCLQRSFGIPYRCITPRNIQNLYVAGRPISATHEAFAASRINGTCIALGEAIGTAASLALAHGDTRQIDVRILQVELERQGAVVHRKIIH